MKKAVFLALAVLAVSLMLVGVALANGGPHGGYTLLEDNCAGCHRAHTAIGARLLSASSTYNLCTSCHNGTGANTDVLDGAYLSSFVNPRVPGQQGAFKLLGGGFEYFGGTTATSRHNADGTVSKAWGLGTTVGPGSSIALSTPLTCASCHDPHGSTNYRMVKPLVNSLGTSINPADEGEAETVKYRWEQYGGGSLDGVTLNAGISAFCAACHTAYREGASLPYSGSTPKSYSGTNYYRHRVDMPWNAVPSTVSVGSNNPETTGVSGVTLPLADIAGAFAGVSRSGGESEAVICLTCHYAHGTTATQGTYSAAASQNSSSALLRISNRGVCQVCHQK